MMTSPKPSPVSEPVHVVDVLFVPEPEIVQVGVPPCLKCGLAARASDAATAMTAVASPAMTKSRFTECPLI
jgi:hypothetical protein